MSLLLPPSDSPVRDLFDLADLARLAAAPANLPTLRDAIQSGRGFLRAVPMARGVNTLVRRHDGSIALFHISPRSQRELWNFGHVC